MVKSLGFLEAALLAAANQPQHRFGIPHRDSAEGRNSAACYQLAAAFSWIPSNNEDFSGSDQ